MYSSETGIPDILSLRFEYNNPAILILFIRNGNSGYTVFDGVYLINPSRTV